MSRRYKVLMVHCHYQIRGGEDSSFDAETELLREGGHEVETYVRDNFEVDGQSKAKTAIETIWSRRSAREIEGILKGGRFDVMHVQNFFPLISASIYSAAKRSGVAVVQTLRNYRLMCANGLLARDGKPCESCLGKAFGWAGVRHKCYRGSTLGSAVIGGMNTFHRRRGTFRKEVDRYIVASEVARVKYQAAGFPAEAIRLKPNVVHSLPAILEEGGRDGAIYVGRIRSRKESRR